MRMLVGNSPNTGYSLIKIMIPTLHKTVTEMKPWKMMNSKVSKRSIYRWSECSKMTPMKLKHKISQKLITNQLNRASLQEVNIKQGKKYTTMLMVKMF